MPVNVKNSVNSAALPSLPSSPKASAPATAKTAGPTVPQPPPGQKKAATAPEWSQGPDGFGKPQGRAPRAAPQGSAAPLPQNIRPSAVATPVAPRGQPLDVKQECDNLGKKHGAACTTQIYQSDRLSGTAVNEHPGTSNGVCVGMSSEWIRSNLQDAKHGGTSGAETFKLLAENKTGGGAIHPHFVHMQTENMAADKRFNQKIGETQTALQKYDDMKNTPEPSKWNPLARPKPSDQEVEQQKRHAVGLYNESQTMKQQQYSGLVGNLSTPNFTHKDASFNQMQQKFSGQFPNDGHYQVSIFKPDGTGGHDFAVQMGKQPRLLDPNTGEWQFQSKPQMDNFMKDYTSKIYPSYAGGNFNAVHFPN
jgi:hypothetical protein